MHFGEADISTDIVGESQQNFFRLQVVSAYILFLDEVAASVLQEPVIGTSSTGVTHWKVCKSFFVAGLNLERHF